MDIDAAVLHGILDPGTPYVDHSYVEVFLNDAWVATDAYIVDAALFQAAQSRVLREQRLLGYGVHATGTAKWDGQTPAFSQFNRLDQRPIGMHQWGVFQDVADFYRQIRKPWNRLNPLLRVAMGTLSASANARIEAIRSQEALKPAP